MEDRHRQQNGTAVRRARFLRSEFKGRVRVEKWNTGRGSEAIVSVEEVIKYPVEMLQLKPTIENRK
jgi:hypothetical protein